MAYPKMDKVYETCTSMEYENDVEKDLAGHTTQGSHGVNYHHPPSGDPSSYVLSLDIAGPFIPGVDQEIKGPRYGLVAAYSVPVNGEGVPLPEGLVELRNQTRMVADEDDDIDVEEVDQESQEQKWELDKELDEELSEVEVQQQEVNEQRWREYLKDRRAQPVRSLTFGVPLKSREASDVVAAVAQVYSKVRAMQLPVVRIHSDRAKEFSGGKFQKWCLVTNPNPMHVQNVKLEW